MERKKKKFTIICLLALTLSLILGCFHVSAEESSVSTKKYVVVLDPGHGGYDSGTEGTYNGKKYYESEITWKIAAYLKKELEKQPNIKVYLTRKKKDTYMGLNERIKAASKYKADLFVSLHINASEYSSVNGACVLVSKGNYRPYLAAEEKVFGTYVMEELTGLGLKMYMSSSGGLMYRLSGDGSVYPNGRLKDYYAIVNGSVMANLPGVIIEHAFISNTSDLKNFLSSNSKLKKLAQADARAIVRYFADITKAESNLSADSNVSREPVENGWMYRYGKYFYYKNGSLVTNSLFKVDGEYYYVDENGIRQTGWITYNKKKYYMNTDGKAQKKWLNLDGEKYYFHSSKAYMYTGAKKTAKGNYYVFDSNGKLCSGWCEAGGNTYYVGSKGVALKGYQKIGSNYYYFHTKEAYMYKAKLYKTSTGKTGYAQSNGVLYNKGFITINSKRYYFNTKGVALRGYQKISGKYYYFDPADSFLYKSKLIRETDKDVFFAQKDGTLYTKGFRKSGSKTYYFRTDGKAQRGWKEIEGKWYYFKKTNSAMIQGRSSVISGKTYVFDKNGVCISGRE